MDAKDAIVYNAALDDAATICEKQTVPDGEEWTTFWNEACKNCAGALLAAKIREEDVSTHSLRVVRHFPTIEKIAAGIINGAIINSVSLQSEAACLLTEIGIYRDLMPRAKFTFGIEAVKMLMGITGGG